MKEYKLSYVQTTGENDLIVAVDPTGEECAMVCGCIFGFSDSKNSYDIQVISETLHNIKCLDDDCWEEWTNCITLEDVLREFDEENANNKIECVLLSETVELDEDYIFDAYPLKNDEILGLGNEYCCSVETIYTNFMDDEYNGDRDECIEYCFENDLVLGVDAQIAHIYLNNGLFDYCCDVEFNILPEVIDAYDKNEWNDADVRKYAELNDNDVNKMDGHDFLEYIRKEGLYKNLRQ